MSAELEGGTMSRRKRLLMGLAALTAVGLGVTTGAWPESTPRPCRATFERVKVGMSRAEVEATVGGPAGHYIPGEAPICLTNYGLFTTEEPWVANDGVLYASFSGPPDERVTHLEVVNLPLGPPSFFDRLRARLGL